MFTLGLDYGTNSVRAVVVRCSDGAETGTPASFAFFGRGSVAGVRVPILIILAVFAGTYALLNYSAGRYFFALGGNEESARLSGVQVRGCKRSRSRPGNAPAGRAAVLTARRKQCTNRECSSFL